MAKSIAALRQARRGETASPDAGVPQATSIDALRQARRQRLQAPPVAPREIPTPTLRPVSAGAPEGGVAPPGTAAPLLGEGGEVVTLAPPAPVSADRQPTAPDALSLARFAVSPVSSLARVAGKAVAASLFPTPPLMLTAAEIPGGEEIIRQNNAWLEGVVTPEMQKNWKALGAIGVGESYRKLNKWEMIPFLNGKVILDLVPIVASFKKFNNGEFLTDDEKDGMRDYILDMAEIQARGYTLGGQITDAGLRLPAYIGEIGVALTTAGAAFPALVAKQAAKSAAKAGAKQFIKTAAKRVGKVAVLGAVATTVMPHRVVKKAINSHLNDSMGITDKGRAFIQESEKSPAVHTMRALGDVFIENFSEFTGAALLRPITKGIGRVVGRVLPKKFVLGFQKLAEKATNLTFRKAMAKLGWDGLLEEIGEERVGDLLRVSFDLDPEEGFSTDQFLGAIFPDTDQFLVEIGVLSIFGGASRATFALAGKLKRRGVSEEKIDAVMNNLSELEKEATLSNFIDIEETQEGQDLDENLALLADLEAIDQSAFSAEQRKEAESEIQRVRIDVDTLEASVAARAAQIQVQETTGFRALPVPRKPETLSQFIIRKGGINLDTEESRRITKKEQPSLRGVAKKTGTLSVDEATRLAAEAGFITETPFDIQDPLAEDISEFGVVDALEREAGGVDVVRDADLVALQERDAIIAFNEQQEIESADITELTTFQEAFQEGVALASKDIKAAQEVLVEAIEGSGLTLNDRAKFLRTIKNIQTPAQLAKAAPDIEARILRLLKTEAKRIENPAKVNLRNRIKKIIGSVKKRKDVAVDIVANIRKLEADLKTTGVLAGGQIADTPIELFEKALGDAQVILAEGQAKLAIAKAQKQQRQDDRLAALAVDTVPLSNTEFKTAGLGEQLSVVDRTKNLWITVANKTQRVGINKNPMDVIFDVLDGALEYKGANSRVFKKTMDRSYNKFLQLKEEVTRPIKDLADKKVVPVGKDGKKRRLNEGNYERIGTWAALQQKDGREKLLNTGITQKEIDNLKLTDSEMEMFLLMREKLDALRPALQEVMLVVYNKNFKRVKDYFPFMTDFKAMNDLEIQQMFGNDSPLITDTAAEFAKKDVAKGFTKERKGAGKQKVRLDALGVFLSHVDNATYLIEMAQPIKELGELSATSAYREMAGDFGQQIAVDWIDLLARKGRVGGNIDWLDGIRINTGAAILGFKLSSALIQPTALLDGAAFVGPQYVTRGVTNVANKEWRIFMKKNMPEIRERVGDDPNYIDLEGDGIVKKVQRAGFYALKNLDLLAASAVASGAYIKSVEQRGGVVDLSAPDALAIEEAQLAVRRTQSSAFAKDSPPIISQGKLTGNISVDKLILQFQSFMLNRWSLIQHDFWNAGVKKGRTKQSMNVAMFLILASFAELSIRHYSKELIALMTGAEPPEEKDLLEAIVKQTISNVPLVSSLVASSEYGSVPVPAVSLVEGVFESLSFAVKSKSTEKRLKNAGLAALMGSGVAGVPGTLQTKQIIQSATKKPKKKKRSRQ